MQLGLQRGPKPSNSPGAEEAGGNIDARNIINARNCEREEAELVNPRGRGNQGWWHNGPNVDRSPFPKRRKPRAFRKSIHQAPFLAWFRPRTNLTKYSGDTTPGSGSRITAWRA
jgi:hypothetical protein